VSGGFVASAVAAGVLLAVAGRHGGNAEAAPGTAAAKAIAYARAQIGDPYQWGGTGPGAFDCSGLVMMAYRAAGVSIARTSQAQWATEPHVSVPAPGDLVFFAGADGTPSSPGHVGLVVDPSRDLMIDAYAPGVPVHEETYGQPGSAPGLQDPVGFTDPSGGS
jgi:cell wall-associated NlpC family hydrolase